MTKPSSNANLAQPPQSNAPAGRAGLPGVPEPTKKQKVILFLFKVLPHHLISRLTYFVTRIRGPHVTLLIRWFIGYYGVAMHEAEEPDITSYETFNEFFTRALNHSMRPIAAGNNIIISPCDGAISQAGAIRAGAILQAKGRAYSVLELLGGNRELAAQFGNGRYATVYLSPHNYHRVHMPIDANLVKMIHVPGKLFSVSNWMLEQVPRVFARNERLACHFQTAFGPMVLVMVGAMNVSALETNWTGPIRRSRGVNEFDFTHTKQITQKGMEMGRFNMGSTVILLFNDKMKLLPQIKPGQTIRMGQAIGHFPG